MGLKTYYKTKTSGQCWLCREKVVGSQVYCDEHRRQRAEQARLKRASDTRICPSCNARPLDWHRRLCAECANPLGERYHKYQKGWRDAQKLAAFNAYGGAVCACCGERELAFLTLDHIASDGAAHRRALKEEGLAGTGWKFFSLLKNKGYPPGFQVLCCNCNRGRWMNGGTCPHQLSQQHPVDQMLQRFRANGLAITKGLVS